MHARAYDYPPVFVRKSLMTFPWHLGALLYYYLKFSNEYDTIALLYMLIPSQMLYLILQFNRCTVYGNKIIKINYTLLLVALVYALIGSLPVLFYVILSGAPITTMLFETWTLSLHYCFLAYPLIYSVCNCDFKVGLWNKYFVIIAAGGWLSCIVIPLDWDRDWQQWPIPIVVGIYLGAILGFTFGSYIP